jgi:hypothetical protein
MEPTPFRAQLRRIALGYAAVFAVVACLLFRDRLWELNNPVDASGGMHAGGDLILYLFFAFLFMIPTVFLIKGTARFEAFYTAYSKLLLGLSLTSPVYVAAFYLGENRVGPGLMSFSFYRLFGTPFILVGMAISRLVARFDRAKRFASYALLIEVLTLGTGITLLFLH